MDKFLNKVIFFFSIILIIYVFYKSEFAHNGEARGYYLKYFLISFIFLFFSLLFFFVKENLKKNILLTFFSVYISLIFIEIILFYKIQINYHETLKYNYLKKKNPETFLKIYPSFFLEDLSLNLLPLSGMSKKQIVVCKEEKIVSTFNSDRFGFNNPDEEWDKDEIGIIMLGDSFVFGNCVNENDTISANFRKLYNKKDVNNFSVLNLGQSASGPLLQLAILREYLPKNKKINKLIWFYYEQNDLENLNKELKNPLLNNYLKDKNFTQNLNNLNEEKDLIVKRYHDQKVKNIENYISDNFAFGGLISNIIKLRNIRRFTIENKNIISSLKFYFGDNNKLNQTYLYPDKPNLHEFNFLASEKLILEFKKIAEEIKNITYANNIETYFVYIPSLYRLDNNTNLKFTDKIENKNYSAADNFFAYNRVKQIINNLDFKIIDLNSDFFLKQKKPRDFFTRSYRSHFTIKGYKKISMFIYENLNVNN